MMGVASLAETLAGFIVGEASGQGSRRAPRDETTNQQDRQMPNRPLGAVVDSATELANRAINKTLKGLQYLLIFGALLLSAIIIYGALYCVVMPQRLHDRPIYFDYSSRATTGGATATVDFQAQHTQWDLALLPIPIVERPRKKLLRPGQHYEVGLELLMPTSYVNRKVGVFMVHTTLMDDQDSVLATSARPAMLPHTSSLLKGLTMLFAWPLYLLGLKKEAETISVSCIDFYKEDSQHPLSKVKVTVSSGRVQLYRASIHVTPQLKGLPWLMYDWFYSTLVAGVIFITSIEVMLIGFVYFFFFAGSRKEHSPRSSRRQSRVTIRAAAGRHASAPASSTPGAGARATAAGEVLAENNEGLRRRSVPSSSSERQEMPPGVQAYQRGVKYEMRDGRGSGTSTGTYERPREGGPKRSDPPGRVDTQERAQSAAMASWVALEGNLDGDGGEGKMEGKLMTGNSAIVENESVINEGHVSMIQPEGDEFGVSSVVREEHGEGAVGGNQ